MRAAALQAALLPGPLDPLGPSPCPTHLLHEVRCSGIILFDPQGIAQDNLRGGLSGAGISNILGIPEQPVVAGALGKSLSTKKQI